jgi:thymidylate synthase (FAD)
MHVKYIDKMGNDERAVSAARLSFDRESQGLNEKDLKLLGYLGKHSHLTPFEHCMLTLEIKAPIYISKQIMRHRTFSYSEVSRRYTSENIEFYRPNDWRRQSESSKQCSDAPLDQMAQQNANETYDGIVRTALTSYQHLLDIGVSKEQARNILPQCLYTRWLMTGNLRNWIHFIKLRIDKTAQGEAQYIAKEAFAILKQHFPHSTDVLLSIG